MVTLRKIAEEAEVSVATVSQVLNGKYKETWPAMAERSKKIREIADRLNYRPNSAARAMLKQKFDSIALVQDTQAWGLGISHEFTEGVYSVLEKKGIQLSFTRLPNEKAVESGFVPRFFQEMLVDGLIIMFTTGIPKKMRKLIKKYDIPCVYVNEKMPENAVYPDDFNGSYQLTKEIIKRGIKSIGYADFFIDTPFLHYSKTDRYEGYLKAINEVGLEPKLLTFHQPIEMEPEPVIMDETEQFIDQIKYCQEILKSPDCPEAIVCYGNELSLFQKTMNLIPGFDHSSVLLASFSGEKVHTTSPIFQMIFDNGKLGKEATEMLLKKINNPDKTFESKAVEMEFFPIAEQLPNAICPWQRRKK